MVGDPAPAYRALARPEDQAPNPDYAGAGDLDRLLAPPLQLADAGPGLPLFVPPWWLLFMGAPNEPDGARKFVWALIAGAYKKNPTGRQLLGQVLVAFVPVVGQIGAARDATAYLYFLTRPDAKPEDRLPNAIGLVLSLLVLVPEVGAALAAVLRLAPRAGGAVARAAETVPWAKVEAVLNRMGRGNAFAFARERLTAAAVERDAQHMFNQLMGWLERFARWAADKLGAHPPPVLEPAYVGVGRLTGDLARLRQEGPGLVRDAVQALTQPIEQAIREGQRLRMERAAAGGSTNGRVAAEAKAAHPPEPPGVADAAFPERASSQASNTRPRLSDKARDLHRQGKAREALDTHYEDLVRSRTGGVSEDVAGREVDAVSDDALIQAKRSYSAVDKPRNFLSKAGRAQIKRTIEEANQAGKRAEFWFKYGVSPDVRAYIEGKGGIVRTGLGGP